MNNIWIVSLKFLNTLKQNKAQNLDNYGLVRSLLRMASSSCIASGKYKIPAIGYASHVTRFFYQDFDPLLFLADWWMNGHSISLVGIWLWRLKHISFFIKVMLLCPPLSMCLLSIFGLPTLISCLYYYLGAWKLTCLSHGGGFQDQTYAQFLKNIKGLRLVISYWSLINNHHTSDWCHDD